MKIEYRHPEFGVWHLAETPLKYIPCGALIKWFDRMIQFGFHLGGGKIAWRDGIIPAESLGTDPGLPWKQRACVLAREREVVVFRQETLRARTQTGVHATRQEFISACLGDDLGTWGNFPVWLFKHYGRCFLHPIAPEAVYAELPCEKNGGKIPPVIKWQRMRSIFYDRTEKYCLSRQKRRLPANNCSEGTRKGKETS